jgi:hypothetical protein
MAVGAMRRRWCSQSAPQSIMVRASSRSMSNALWRRCWYELHFDLLAPGAVPRRTSRRPYRQQTGWRLVRLKVEETRNGLVVKCAHRDRFQTECDRLQPPIAADRARQWSVHARESCAPTAACERTARARRRRRRVIASPSRSWRKFALAAARNTPRAHPEPGSVRTISLNRPHSVAVQISVMA